MEEAIVTLFERISRNALILSWWHQCDPLFRDCVCRARAHELSCPLDEIDPEFTGADDLDYLAERFAGTIMLFQEDSASR